MMKKISFLSLLFIAIDSYAQIAIDTSVLKEVLIKNEEGINSENLEFAPVHYHDFILMVKSDENGDKDENIDDYYLNLSYAAKNASGDLSRQAFFDEKINSPMHEGTAWYNDINGNLYFTRTYYDKEKITKKDTIYRKIYEAREENNFKTPIALPFCSEKYSVFHPTLDKRGSMMIFCSDMPGSKKIDLYYSIKTDKWGEPIPLSNTINSDANELFPYLYKDSILFFSSNRQTGVGGLDIYYSLRRDTGWTQPLLLPYPINSSFDDIGFLINKDEKSGYLSSNRPGGKGKDDIYRFESPFKMITTESSSQLVEVTIKVLEKLTFLPILESEISLGEFDINNSFTNEFGNLKVIKQDGSKEILVKMDANMKNNKTFSTKNGEVKLNLFKNINYLISINAKGFEEETLIFKADNKNDNLTFVLNPINVGIMEENEELPNKEIISIPTKVGSIIVFENIYYNYNSTDILVEAAGELDLLYESMVANPTMKIQLSSHTDSRGTFLYNKELSIKRATSAKNYLVKKGIAESRIKTIGFGESRIRNHCSDGVACTEEEHAYNRRTEVLVIE